MLTWCQKQTFVRLVGVSIILNLSSIVTVDSTEPGHAVVAILSRWHNASTTKRNMGENFVMWHCSQGTGCCVACIAMLTVVCNLWWSCGLVKKRDGQAQISRLFAISSG